MPDNVIKMETTLMHGALNQSAPRSLGPRSKPYTVIDLASDLTGSLCY